MPCRGLLFSVYTLFSFFFAALMPGRHLLSAMRQKVSPPKTNTTSAERASKGTAAPLGYPPLLPELGRANSSLRVPSGTATVGRTPRSHPRRRAQPRLARFCPRWLRGAYLCLPTGYKTFSKKVRPCAHPLETVHLPGWSAQRHRASRAGRLRPERPYGSQLFN